MSTEQGAYFSIASETLPNCNRSDPVRPREPATSRSTSCRGLLEEGICHMIKVHVRRDRIVFGKGKRARRCSTTCSAARRFGAVICSTWSCERYLVASSVTVGSTMDRIVTWAESGRNRLHRKLQAPWECLDVSAANSTWESAVNGRLTTSTGQGAKAVTVRDTLPRRWCSRIAEAAGADDEQVGLVLFGDLRNGFRDAAVSQDGVDRSARFRRGLL